MSTQQLSLTAIALLLASTTNAVPSTSQFKTGIVNLVDRGIRTSSPVASGADVIFDPTYPRSEKHRILNKYKLAGDILDQRDLPSRVQEFQLAQAYDTIFNVSSHVPTSNSRKGSQAAKSNTLTSVMPLTDDISGNLDLLYYGPINMGTQNQRMTVDVDTGSADLWVPVGCSNCPHPSYIPQRSANYRSSGQPFSVQYGSGSVSGTLAQDRVTIGTLVIDEQYFGAVSQESADFADSPNDGLIGMAFSSIASSGEPTFFENLISANKIAAPLFSVHLARGQQRGSQMCLGCYDSSKAKGSLSWVPVTSMTYWAVSMPGVQVNGRSANVQRGVTAAIDTGTTLIYFPQAMAQAFYQLIPGSAQANQYGDGFYTYPCNSQITISLELGSNTYAMNTADFNLGRTGSGSSQCVGGILAMGGDFPSNLAIVGDEFLKSWYTVYDYSHGARVGFAPSINNS